jgi:hypothetical protein
MDIMLDPVTHDIKLNGRDMGIVRGDALIAQRLKQNLLTITGEWFLDRSVGLPWFTEIFQKGTSLDRIRQYFIREIVNTKGVTVLNSLTMTNDPATRKLTVNFVVNGNVNINFSEVF